MPIELRLSKFDIVLSLPTLNILTLFASAALVLGWVGFLTWNDISVWNKDIGTIFFGSRAGEAISLGIGMAVIHYLLIGVSLFAAGTVMFLRNHVLSKVPEQELMQMASQQKKMKKVSSKKVKTEVKPAEVKEENAAAHEERFFSGCLHHFGYLSSRPQDSPIPQECILCQRLGDCMVATIYVKKINE